LTAEGTMVLRGGGKLAKKSSNPKNCWPDRKNGTKKERA